MKMNVKYVILGLICLIFASVMYVLPVSAVSEAVPDEVYEAFPNYTPSTGRLNSSTEPGAKTIPPEAVNSYQSDIKILSTYLNNPIHPALLDENNIIYNDIDFYIYSQYMQDYEISIYLNSVDDPIIFEGETAFMAMHNFMVPDGVKKIKKIVAIVGPTKYEWTNIRIMHKGIDEKVIYTSPAAEVTRRELWLKNIQAFIAGIFACIVFAFAFWRFWKRHLESEIQDVI